MEPEDLIEAPISTPAPQKRTLWNKLGGGALTIAVFFHIILFIIGAIWIFQIIREPEKTVDFLPGDGERGGSERSAQHKIQQKKQAQITPTTNVKRVFAEGATSNFVIPEPGDSFGQMSALSSLAGGGSMGGGGLGGTGGGKGFGSGTGSGLGTKGLGIKMFGLELQGTEKIAVVMDVSRSMTKYLPLVSKELDKLPSTAPLVLYFGCGLATPSGKKPDDKIRLTAGPQFDRFWQVTQGAPLQQVFKSYDSLKYDPKGQMPLAPLHKEMANRPDTYFLDFNGIHFTQAALMCKEVSEADTIYWFADFQDKVDESEMKDVLRKLKSRKQKLIMHAPVKGRNFDLLEKELAKRSGGQAIFQEVGGADEVKKKKKKK